jgi:hypothetical protein
MKENYNAFCLSKKCPHVHHREQQFGGDTWNITFCELYGVQDAIYAYPPSCIHLREIKGVKRR